MSARTVVIGDALIDEIHDELGAREFVGGAALNVAVGLATLGVPTSLVAMVGDDEAGAVIRTFLAEHGVELLASPSAHGSSRAVSERVDGEPQYTFNAAALSRRLEFDPAQRAAIEAAPAVLVSCYPFDDAQQTDALLDAVGTDGERLIVDANPRPHLIHDRAAFAAGAARVTAVSALAKIGDDDVPLLYGDGIELTQAVTRAIESGARAVLATAGSRGAFIRAFDGIAVEHGIVPMDGPVIDTMGAGDSTLATVASAFIRTESRDEDFWSDALARAMRVAAATCRAEGALLRVP
jgi:fructokinase